MSRASLLFAGSVSDALSGSATGTYTLGDIYYQSSIDPSITNLYARYAFDPGFRNQTTLILMHGYAQDASALLDADLQRFAAYGCFAVAVGMRGRNGASGVRDSGGREIYDIIDAIRYVQANWPGRVHYDRAAGVGFSGGGGNIYSLLAKAPDLLGTSVAHFGILDYGFDGTKSMWFTNPSTCNSQLAIDVGNRDAPTTAMLAAYESRNAAEGIAGGLALNPAAKLYTLCDTGDTLVDPAQNTERATTILTAAGLSSQLETHVSMMGDAHRWTHGDASQPDLIFAQSFYSADLSVRRALAIAPTGTMPALGFLATKRFEIWLSGSGSTPRANDGVSAVVGVTWDTGMHSYIVTPVAPSSVCVEIFEGARYIKRTISSTTTLIAA